MSFELLAPLAVHLNSPFQDFPFSFRQFVQEVAPVQSDTFLNIELATDTQKEMDVFCGKNDKTEFPPQPYPVAPGEKLGVFFLPVAFCSAI
jgi:hypothetical protein